MEMLENCKHKERMMIGAKVYCRHCGRILEEKHFTIKEVKKKKKNAK